MDSIWSVIKLKHLMDIFLKHLGYKLKLILKKMIKLIIKISNKSLSFFYNMAFLHLEIAG